MKEFIKRNHRNGNLYLLIALVMMIVLFVSSSMTYQEQSQVSLIDRLLKNEPLKASLKDIKFTYGGSEVSIQAQGYSKFVEFFIRKGAHFGTYFILGGSLFLGLASKMSRSYRGLAILFAWLAATGYAATDEFHQMLTGDRTPLFQDVMLDSVGALTACLLVTVFLLIKEKIRS